MFTGLIEEQGKIINSKLSYDGMEISILCKKILSDIKIGSSICVNGACQSVISFSDNSFTIQASNETLRVSNFKNLKLGDFVNLERPLTLNSRIDGHLVSGHIDCTALLLKKIDDGFCKKFFFQLPIDFSKYIIYKGSIAINGVSLTVASSNSNIFSVELIPETLLQVNLSSLNIGDTVNIETDMFSKYIEKFLNSQDNTSKIDYNFLEKNGFI